MKIQALDHRSKKPVANTKIQIQIKGKDSCFLTFTTDESGFFELEDQFRGQQIALFIRGAGVPTQWTTASSGAILPIETPITIGAKEKSGSETGSF